jgi:hypothetical protein
MKGYSTHLRYPYILEKRADWERNIILAEVADYIRNQRAGFPLHRYVHHGLSSQAMIFNLVGPLIVRNDLAPLVDLLEERGIEVLRHPIHAEFEFEERKVFKEDVGQPTSIDLVLQVGSDSPSIFIESKLAETGFGGCSLFSQGDCDGRNPAKNFSLCYLHHIGRHYWQLLEKHGFLLGSISQDVTCIMATHYQFFREVLLALELGGSFVLLYDARNPSIACDGRYGARGIWPFLSALVPESHRHKVKAITIQMLVAKISATGRHEWISDFRLKYGLKSVGMTTS